jgi:hypothetical protein
MTITTDSSTNKIDGAASSHDNATIIHVDPQRIARRRLRLVCEGRRLHFLVFLGISLCVACKLGEIMNSSDTLWDSNSAASAVDKKVEETTKDFGKILAEVLPDLPVELRIENIQDHTRRKHFEHLASVHLSDTSTRSAGRCVAKPPSLAKRASPELLQCIVKERQGLCYKDVNNASADKSRNSLLVKGALDSSPGILKEYDPYVWESNDEAYAVFPPGNGTNVTLAN